VLSSLLTERMTVAMIWPRSSAELAAVFWGRSRNCVWLANNRDGW